MADLVTRMVDGFIRLATELKSHKTLLNGNVVGLSALNTTEKANLVAAINEVKAATVELNLNLGARIDDESINSTVKTWSITKIKSEIDHVIDQIMGSAPDALNSVFELAQALQNDPNVVAALQDGLGKRLKFDAPQTLTPQQKSQGCANLGIGEPDTNFITVIEGGLA